MKLNRNVIKDILNYIIEKQSFDFDNGCMTTIELLTIVKDLSKGDEEVMQEVACSLYRCIQEGLVVSNYPKTIWGKAAVYDVTFRGFTWLENN